MDHLGGVNMKKKGVTLITLVITIILVLILLGITTISVGNAIQNAKYTAFGKDLATIEGEVVSYYIQNGEYPILEEVKYIYERGQLVGDNGSNIPLNQKREEYLETFRKEMILNSDLSDGEQIVPDTYFYKIDLEKIGVSKITRGTLKEGENDIYVMAYPSEKIYYVKGLVAQDTIYFSLAQITNLNKIDKQQEVTKFEKNGILVTKEKKAWTNQLGIHIEATLSDDEKITIQIPVRKEEIILATTTGKNEIDLKTLRGSLQLTDYEINQFHELEWKDKYLYLIKRKNGIETARMKIDLSNYETEAPRFPLKEDQKTLDFTVISEEGYNRVRYQGLDSISGIGEVRYVYYKQFDASGTPQDLITDPSILTEEYMLQNGKKASVSNEGRVEMKLPKDIEGIYITMFDKAGNSVSLRKNVQTDTYIGIHPMNVSSMLKFHVLAKSKYSITSATASISLDGKNFMDEKRVELVQNQTGDYLTEVDFSFVEQEEVYIKIVTYENSQILETRIKKISLKEIAKSLVSSAEPGLIYEENREYIDKNGRKALIPAGFKVSSNEKEQIIEDGMVVIDKEDNEFVWIPVDQKEILYVKNFNYPSQYGTTANNTEDDETIVSDEGAQIAKYGGFYISRYEAGKPDQKMVDNSLEVPVSRRGVKAWTNLTVQEARTKAEQMYQKESSVKSSLLTGTAWDTVCTWLSSTVASITDSTIYGNYTNTSFSYYDEKGELQEKEEGMEMAVLTGNSEYTNVKNIYDMAGNVWEWTNEKFQDHIIFRGGSYQDSGKEAPITYRYDVPSDQASEKIGFRIMLWIE